VDADGGRRLVLVIACANLAAFLLARAVDRRKEIAVRLALGAGKGQLVAQFMVETVLLALLGGAAGLMLARTALGLVLAADLPLPVPLTSISDSDWRVLGFSALVSVIAGMLFGLVPAMQATRFELASVIRDESGGGGRRARPPAAGPGGRPGCGVRWCCSSRRVSSCEAWMPCGAPIRDSGREILRSAGWRPRCRSTRPHRCRLLHQRIAELPGVEAVGLIDNIPLNLLSNSSLTLSVDGVPPPPGQEGFDIEKAAVDTGLLRGRRVPAARGPQLHADRCARRALGRDHQPGLRGPLLARSRRRGSAGPRQGGRSYEIVGVVNTTKIRSLGEDPRPAVYVPLLHGTRRPHGSSREPAATRKVSSPT
jgi:hypothetical protein